MKHIQITKILTLLLALAVITACGNTVNQTTTIKSGTLPEDTSTVAPTFTPESTKESQSITLMTHDSFNASEDVIAAFEQANKVKLEILRSGDAGAALNQAILSKDAPLADVFFGIDNTFFSRATESDILEAYNSPLLADIPAELKLDAENMLLPVDYGDVCLNYDKAWFADNGLEPPTTLEDLLDTRYKNLVVVENPATSSPGLAFLMATVAHFGDPGYLDFWRQLAEQGVMVTSGWEDAYYGQFTRYEGQYPLVVSYASSPPAEVFFAETELDEAPTASVVGDGACFRQIEFVGILRGTEKRELAEKLVDFLLSKEFQEDIPLNMFVFPANQTAELPDVFVQHTQIPENPATLSPDEIGRQREAWINAWTETVLR